MFLTIIKINMRTITVMLTQTATRADIGMYNRISLCTQYIDVAVVNSAAAATYIALEKEKS